MPLLDRILPYVVDLERRLEMASRAVKATSGDVVLKVRCASGLLPFVVRAIKPFRDNHPEYKFEVSAVHTPPVGSVMDADLGIWASLGTSPRFTFEDLGVVPSWLCATPSFLERHSVRTVEDLDKVPLLGCSHWIAPFLIAPAVDPLLPVRRDLRMAVNFNSVQDFATRYSKTRASAPPFPPTRSRPTSSRAAWSTSSPNSPARPSSSDSYARRPTSPFLKSNGIRTLARRILATRHGLSVRLIRPPKNHEGPASRMETGPCSCPGCCIHPFWARRP